MQSPQPGKEVPLPRFIEDTKAQIQLGWFRSGGGGLECKALPTKCCAATDHAPPSKSSAAPACTHLHSTEGRTPAPPECGGGAGYLPPSWAEHSLAFLLHLDPGENLCTGNQVLYFANHLLTEIVT